MKSINNWANAIFEIAKEENLLAKYKDFALAIIKTIDEDNSFVTFLDDQFIDYKDKEKVLAEIFVNDIYFKNTILLLVKENKSFYIKRILEVFLKYVNKELKIKNALVWTTEKLDENILQKINELMEKKYNQKFEMTNKIDSTILGGIKLEIDNKVYDYSVKNNLLNLYEKIMKGE